MWKFEVNFKQVYISWLKGTLALYPAAWRHLSGFLLSIDTIKGLKKNPFLHIAIKYQLHTFSLAGCSDQGWYIACLFLGETLLALSQSQPYPAGASSNHDDGDPYLAPHFPTSRPTATVSQAAYDSMILWFYVSVILWFCQSQSTKWGCWVFVSSACHPYSALTTSACRGYSATEFKSSKQTLMSYARLTDTPVEGTFTGRTFR